MAPFDPKEYKRNIVVFNLRQKDKVLLVMPTGAKVAHPPALSAVNYPDGRKIVTVKASDSNNETKDTLRQIII